MTRHLRFLGAAIGCLAAIPASAHAAAAPADPVVHGAAVAGAATPERAPRVPPGVYRDRLAPVGEDGPMRWYAVEVPAGRRLHATAVLFGRADGPDDAVLEVAAGDPDDGLRSVTAANAGLTPRVATAPGPGPLPTTRLQWVGLALREGLDEAPPGGFEVELRLAVDRPLPVAWAGPVAAANGAVRGSADVLRAPALADGDHHDALRPSGTAFYAIALPRTGAAAVSLAFSRQLPEYTIDAEYRVQVLGPDLSAIDGLERVADVTDEPRVGTSLSIPASVLAPAAPSRLVFLAVSIADPDDELPDLPVTLRLRVSGADRPVVAERPDPARSPAPFGAIAVVVAAGGGICWRAGRRRWLRRR